MASSLSSSSITLQDKYDVFLSFRGEDTRDNFTSHLYASLCQKQIQTFIDDDGLNRGDEISPALLKAIEESKISVIIFSKHYASSKWCLDELVKILECKEKNGQMVMPIFYHVNPSDVRKQTGSFKDAFVKHEKIFKKAPEKVQRWRAALVEASNLCGWDSVVIRPESKLVGDIVREVLKKLNEISPSNDCKDLVGIDFYIDCIKSLLCIGLFDFRIVGIWGMGGIGKTTIAGAVFNQISNQFESRCFILNVREQSEKHGLVYVRNQLLSQLLEEENLRIDPTITREYVKDRLQHKRVFIVLDDVDDIEQLEFLITRNGQLGPGSRVIITTRDKQVVGNYVITTRDKQVVGNYGVDNIYAVEGLKYHEALQLFSSYAFKQKNPPKDFSELSDKVIDYAKGNPLALKVLGSSLYLKGAQDWESVLHKLKRIPNKKIQNVLKISYNELDDEEQNIFLDIVCYFKGEDNDLAVKILDTCYLSARDGIYTLINKSLITRSANNKLEMHDLLQTMGWEIIRQQSSKKPGKRRRLWNHDDVFNVLENNTGTDVVEGLVLDMSKLNQSLHLRSDAFENMPNLKFLKFYVPDGHLREFVNISKVHLPQGLKYLSNKLRYLHWHGYPLKTLPKNFSGKNLVVLQLPFSNVDEQFWVEKKDASDFKSIELYQSDARERKHRPSFLYIPSSIQYLSNLLVLNLFGCDSLRSFPSNIRFRSLITLTLSGCSNFSIFPQISENLKELYLTETAIDEVPSSIACLTGLETLSLWHCKRLKRISTSMYKLKSLHGLCLSDCRISKSQLSYYIAGWKELQYLELVSCNITEIPTSIKQLSRLRELVLYDCNMLRSIPELPLALHFLDARNCLRLQSIAEPPSNLEELGESELEMVSENFYSSSSSDRLFIFTNSQKLNCNSQQIIQHTSALALRIQQIRSTKVFDKRPGISILCLPGSEIPEWFSDQILGSTISIKIHRHGCNQKLVGFALSAVLAFEKSYGEDLIDVICSYDYGNSDKFEWECFVGVPKSDHIVLGYTPSIDPTGDYATFEFRLYNACTGEDFGVEEGLKLKSCGVHPLYVQPNVSSEDLGEIKSEESEDLMNLHDANTSGSGSGSGDGNGTYNEEEVEPNGKTYCSLRASCLLLFLFVLFGCWSLLMICTCYEDEHVE